MGKKSLIKSTSKKKKTASKKKDEDKKSTVSKTTDVTKPKAGQKVDAKKRSSEKETASDKDLTLKNLIFRKFDKEVPEKLFKVEAVQRKYTSPPIISTTDDTEAERLKKLLFKKIDLVSSPEKGQKTEEFEKPKEDKKAKNSVKEKKVEKTDYKEIMARKFHQTTSSEISVQSPQIRIVKEKDVYTAPPLISTTDMKEAERLKKLLFRKMDLTSPPQKSRKPEEAKMPVNDKPVESKKVVAPVEEKEVKKADRKEIMARKFHQPPSSEISVQSPHIRIVKEKDVYTAPPLISTTDMKEAERLKKLLFRKMDLTSPPQKSREPEEAKMPVDDKPVEGKKVVMPVEEKEVKKADYKEIMARKFHEPQQVTMLIEGREKLIQKKKEDFSAPPLISTDDPKEAVRLKELLFRQFEIPPAPVQPTSQTIEEKAPETIVPEIVSETEELAVGAKEEPIIPVSEKIEEEKIEKEDKSPEVTVSYDEPPPTHTEVSDPMDKMIKFVAAGVILILLLIIGYSFSNKNNYYIKPVKDGIEIWQGTFSPMGEEVVATLTGVTPPENIKDVYKAEEVLPLAFVYFVDQADGLLYINSIPDLKAIKDTLDKALSFALTNNEREIVYYRLNSMEQHIMQHKANVAASGGTPEDITVAIGILSDVLKLDMDEQQKSMIQSRIDYLNEYKEQSLVIEAPPADEIQVEENDAIQEKAVEQKSSEDDDTIQEKASEQETSEDEAVEVEESDENQGAGH